MLANAERAMRKANEYGLDGLIATTPGNVTYLSGFRALSHQAIGSHVFVVLPCQRDVEPAIIVPAGELADLLDLNLTWVKDVRPYGTFFIESTDAAASEVERRIAQESSAGRVGDPCQVLLEVLREKNLDHGRLGVDEGHVTPSEFEKLGRQLPGAKLVFASKIFQAIRSVKTEQEVATLSRSSAITETAITQTLEHLRVGMPGGELVRTFNASIIDNGGLPAFSTVSLGKKSFLQYTQLPPTKRVEKGDLIRFDVGCVYQNYFSDIARTAIVGEPEPKHVRYYESLVKGEQAALSAIKPGVACSEIFCLAVETVRESGIPHYRRHHCGHGIGIELYDPPLIAAQEDTLLEKGMVLCVETPYYEVGFGGLQVEDMIVVTERTFEYITKLERELAVVSG